MELEFYRTQCFIDHGGYLSLMVEDILQIEVADTVVDHFQQVVDIAGLHGLHFHLQLF